MALFWFRRHARAATSWLEPRLVKLPRVLRRAGEVSVGLLGQFAQTLGVLTDARTLLMTKSQPAMASSAEIADVMRVRAPDFMAAPSCAIT